MADDTVEQARHMLFLTGDAWVGNPTDVTYQAYLTAVDALIAAVRAENGPKLIAVTAKCQVCGAFCDDITFEYAVS